MGTGCKTGKSFDQDPTALWCLSSAFMRMTIPEEETIRQAVTVQWLVGFLPNSENCAAGREMANIAKMIYQRLPGMSLGGIAVFLYQQGTPSPTGRERRAQPVISDLPSIPQYIRAIVSSDKHFMVQGEKGIRSNLDEDTKQPKAARYSSQSMPSGLLICAVTIGVSHGLPARRSGAVQAEWGMGRSSANVLPQSQKKLLRQ